ncbi:SMI1/KNR4 family protein [Thorsellia anophelis]|uniref:SMI1 / KNR4 family (SUKH-1) n=1 Tax=Thorsellia anophelis DSM 18579 TaxID=1123402 RepID=A0A1I0G3X1_9GAMM|nr:SMI1/KNR4 family protein [Thorsellia anophelis]SET65438.1 SMI1 / KNR4 family (SUKH-1) [Thorsellia anophelis DSM 18579]
MKLNFSSTSKPATEKDFYRLESTIGHKLPTAMKKHYLKYNGGQPEPSDVHDSERLYPINAFLDVNEIMQDYNSTEFDDPLPDKFEPGTLLSFAYDPGDGTYALSLRKEDFGKVYFFTVTDRVQLFGEWKDFQTFLDCIVEDPDD